MVGHSGSDDEAFRSQATGLTVERVVVDRAQVVRAVGEVDMQSAPALAQQLTRALAAASDDHADTNGVVVIDLLGVTFFGSNGLAELVACQQRCGEAGVALRVVADNRAVLRSIEITNVDRVLAVWSTVEQALADAEGVE